MNLKTYRARSIADALAEVKKDLGKDAVILHTRSFKTGGVMGIGARPTFEITAAPAHQLNRKTDTARPRAPAPRPQPPEPADTFTPWRTPTATGVAPDRGAAFQASRSMTGDGSCVVTLPASHARPARAVSTTVAMSPIDQGSRLILEEELSSIKRLVGQVLQCTRRAQAGGPAASEAVLSLGPLSEPLFANYMRLVEGQVATETAESLAGAVRAELTGPELSDPAIVRAALLRHLAERLPATTDPERRGRAADGRPLTIALVGPTGVGKTTTIAKLAALQKLRFNRRVGLITCDTYRIAAVEQLRTYAAIIGLPLKIVASPAEVESACRSMDSCEVVMVDTAGRSQHDGGRIEELRKVLDGVRPHETHLVLSAAAAEPVMAKAADRFGVLRPDRLLFTKLDEAVHFGAILNTAGRTGLRIGYITTGQEVPDHIEPADSHRLARAVLDGEVSA